jgi:hypothetical protein
MGSGSTQIVPGTGWMRPRGRVGDGVLAYAHRSIWPAPPGQEARAVCRYALSVTAPRPAVLRLPRPQSSRPLAPTGCDTLASVRTLSVVLLVVVVSCGGTNSATCVPGDSKSCTGPAACAGYQVCQTNHTYNACMCSTGNVGGGGAALGGAPSGSAGLTGGVGGNVAGGAPGGGSGFDGSAGADGGAGVAGSAGVAGGQTGTAGSVGVAGSSGGSGGAGGGCSSGASQNPPTILILVDLSGSLFDTATTGAFFGLRMAVEQVVMQLQSEVRFGIASFVGDHGTGSCLLDYESVPIALNNYAAIKAAYDSWGPLLPYGAKANGPAVEAIPMVKQTLQSDPGTGQKFMMIVTDGGTDFCADGNALCPADAVTDMIQEMYSSTPSLGTLVMGLPTSSDTFASAVLQNFANAGAGQPVTIPSGSGAVSSADVYSQCNGAGTTAGSCSWSSLYAASGSTGATSLAVYSTTGGTATVYTSDTTSETQLENQISLTVCNH